MCQCVRAFKYACMYVCTNACAYVEQVMRCLMITLNTRYVCNWCSLMIGGDVITISCVEMAMKVEGQSICHKLLLKHEDMIGHYFLVTFIHLQEN